MKIFQSKSKNQNKSALTGSMQNRSALICENNETKKQHDIIIYTVLCTNVYAPFYFSPGLFSSFCFAVYNKIRNLNYVSLVFAKQFNKSTLKYPLISIK